MSAGHDDNNDQRRYIAIVGLGPHARNVYFPLLEQWSRQSSLYIPLIIDLIDQKNKIATYLANQSLRVDQTFYLDINYRDAKEISPDIKLRLDSLNDSGKLDGILLSSEPKSHFAYLKWACENDVDVFLDKPITALNLVDKQEDSAEQIFEDYKELVTSLKNSRSKFVVATHRRCHEGYTLVKSYLNDFIKEYKIPITHIDIYHAGGMWNMPDEFFSRENHPYKYGYGKLMHSGYHLIDLYCWLLKANGLVASKAPDKITLTSQHVSPYDFLHQVNARDYEQLFGKNVFTGAFEKESLKKIKKFGETDVYLSCQLKREDAVITSATLNLLQTSYSRRAWTHLPDDTYRKNGRTRHERVNIQLGHLLNVQVHEYQISREADIQNRSICSEEQPEAFEIHIFRNNELVGGKPYQKITMPKYSRSKEQDAILINDLNRLAKKKLFFDWLDGRSSVSDIMDHSDSVRLLSLAYRCMFRQASGKAPYIQVRI